MRLASGARFIWPVALFLVAAPLLLPHIPPLTDLPDAMRRFALAQILSQDPFLQHYYTYEWRWVGNMGIDLPVAALAPIFGVRLATKMAVIAMTLVMALGVLTISRNLHGRVTPWAILALAFIYSGPMHAGFVNYWSSVAAALLFFGIAIAPSMRDRRRHLLLMSAGVLTWTMHVMGFGILCIMVLGWTIDKARHARDGQSALRAFADLPWLVALPACVQVYWMVRGGADPAMGGWFAIKDKISGLLRVLVQQEKNLETGMLLGMIALATMFAIVGRARIHRGQATIFFLLLLTYLVVPHILMGSWAADLRLAPLLFIAALLSLESVRQLPWTLTVAMAALTLCVGHWTRAYFATGRDLDDALTFLSDLPMHQRVLQLRVDDCDPFLARSDPSFHASALLVESRRAFAPVRDFGASTLRQVPLNGRRDLVQSVRGLPVMCGDPNSYVEALRPYSRDDFDFLYVEGPNSPLARINGRLVKRDGHRFLYAFDH